MQDTAGAPGGEYVRLLEDVAEAASRALAARDAVNRYASKAIDGPGLTDQETIDEVVAVQEEGGTEEELRAALARLNAHRAVARLEERG